MALPGGSPSVATPTGLAMETGPGLTTAAVLLVVALVAALALIVRWARPTAPTTGAVIAKASTT